jgi:hypothetical protein
MKKKYVIELEVENLKELKEKAISVIDNLIREETNKLKRECEYINYCKEDIVRKRGIHK